MDSINFCSRVFMSKIIWILALFLFFILLPKILVSQVINRAEILVENNLNSAINFRIFPVSAVFNGTYTSEGNNLKYSFYPSRRGVTEGRYWKLNPAAIVGGSKEIAVNGFVTIDFDDGDYYRADTVNIIGGIGYALWRLEFYDDSGIREYCYVDYRDANYSFPNIPEFSSDLYFYISMVNNDYKLEFNFGQGSVVDIYDGRIDDKTIKIWHQVGL